MITSSQCKMARAALGWGVRELAEKAQIGVTTINRFETGQTTPVRGTLIVIQQTFEAAGIRFTDEGGVIPPSSPEPSPAKPTGKTPKA
jgi:transcriptional regulator with XRE-family HTH domain